MLNFIKILILCRPKQFEHMSYQMLKRDAKSQGRKYTNKELSRKVNNRTKEKLHANEKLEDFNSIVLDNIIDFNNEIYGDDR